MPTIYEIARETGVSASTAARALRGTGYCSQASREKVISVAKRMGYIPSHAARSLKLKRSQKVLFCIPDIYNPFYFRMIKGASDVLEDHGNGWVTATYQGFTGFADGKYLVSVEPKPEPDTATMDKAALLTELEENNKRQAVIIAALRGVM